MGFAWEGPWRWAWGATAWLAGIALQLQWTALPSHAAVLASVLLSGLASVLLRHRAGWSVAGWLLVVAMVGHAQAHVQAALRLADALPASREGEDLTVTGVVAGLPRVGPAGTAFELVVEAAPAGVPGRLSLSWPSGADPDAWLAGPPPALLAGDRWRMQVRLKRPHGLRNPGGLDLERWLFERGVGATGVVRPGSVRLAATATQPVDRWRQAARDAVLLQVPDARAAGVLAALSIGDQAAIDRASWDLFRVTGVAHLMSISGLHVTMFAWGAGLLVGALWRRWPGALRHVPAPQAARWGGVAAALVYALLAGWGIPAQRTVWMLVAAALLRSAGRRWPWPLVALGVAAIVAGLDPWALLQPGFWLSFVAVCLLMASEPVQPAAPGARVPAWRAALRQQAVATVGLAPLTLVCFQQVSLVGAVANALAIPLVTVLVTPLALGGLLLPALWGLAVPVLGALMQGLAWLAAGSWATWGAAEAPAWAVLAGLVGGAVLVMPLPWRLRGAGLPLMLPLWLAAPAAPAEGELRVLAADVGQGTAVLVRTRRHLLVYDTGPRHGDDSDAGARVLLPLLRNLGEPRIDRLVLSHRDSDHIGGAASLLAGMPVVDSLSTLEASHPLRTRLPAHRPCVAAADWTWDGVRFEVLHPSADALARGGKPNTLSCLIRVVDRRGPRLLLTGDLEAAQELDLVERLGADRLRAAILMLPHHGSRTSSTPEWLRAVQPEVAVAQAGYRSRFGHPAPVVVERLRQMAIPLRRSDTCGAWHGGTPGTPSDARDATGACERDRGRRYWHHPDLP